MTYKEIYEMDPLELFEWMKTEFDYKLPEQIKTVDDMEQAAALMMKLSSYQNYLAALLAYGKIATRKEKRDSEKELWEDMVDRKTIVERMLKAVEFSYTTLSRAVTIKIQNDKELYMNDGSI